MGMSINPKSTSFGRVCEDVFDAGFETLLAQSKLDTPPNPQGPVTTALQGFTNILRTTYVDLKLPNHEMWKTEESFAASQRWSTVGGESGKMIKPHGRGSIYGPIEYCDGHQDAISRAQLGMIFSATLEDGGVAGAWKFTPLREKYLLSKPSSKQYNATIDGKRRLEIMHDIDNVVESKMLAAILPS